MESKTLTVGPEPVSWAKVLLWVTLFFFAWNWQSIPPLISNGELVGPDDFLRLHQVKNWLAGQGWFDLSVSRMNPPVGGDIHWSRLVDVPIAGMIVFLQMFVEPDLAWRIAAILWPLVLFLATVAAIVAICDRLVTNYNRLLAVLFSVLCVSSIQEFVPGRFDHHNVQILLINLVLLGLVSRAGWVADFLVGAMVPVSLSIGLDSAMLFLPALAYLGLEWSIARPGAAGRLRRIGLIMGASSVLVFGLAFPPANWGDSRCDAFSLYYLSALVFVSVGFVALSLLDFVDGFLKRFGLGTVVGLSSVGLLLWLFPHCAGGPLSEMGEEASSRWLASVQEARGIIQLLSLTPEKWLSVVAYLSIMLVISTYVVMRQVTFRPQLGILFFILLICIVGIFYQFRVLRTGLYVVIPFCVVFAAMSWNWLQHKLPEKIWITYGAQTAICIVMLSATWSFAGAYLLPANTEDDPAETITKSEQETNTAIGTPKIRRPDFCFREQDTDALRGLQPGLVMADLNSAAPILVFSQHSVVAGPYHRNEAAILSVLDFFGADLATAENTARQAGIDYVAICSAGPSQPTALDSQRLDQLLRSGQAPHWMTWISGRQDRLLVLQITD